MSGRALGRLLGVYVFVLALACAYVRAHFTLDAGPPREIVASQWRGGKLEARRVATAEELGTSAAVREVVVGEGPLPSQPLLMSLALVAGRDGVKAELAGKTVYVTPDDLLSAQAYDRGHALPGVGLTLGTDVQVVWALLADRLGASVAEVRRSATLHRVRFERRTRSITPDGLTPDLVREAVTEAARHLARGVSADGHFRYLIDAPTNRTLAGYDYPRHAGATYFLAQAAALTHDPAITQACLRAASLLRDQATVACGDARCIGVDDVVDLGSTALAVIAFSEIVRTHVEDGYATLIPPLTRFLHEQQRPDGSFSHYYERSTKTRLPLQVPYYAGEATLALARAHRVTGDASDLEGATRGLAHLVGPAWSFFGDRYYFAEEHWTCQAMEELWERAPSERALDRCLRWQEINRALQLGPGESPHDGDGAYQLGTVVTPRLTPAASRCEAGLATLRIASLTGRPEGERRALDAQLRRSLALLLREQLRPGPTHLFVDPEAVRGAFPGSPVDYQLRIDYAQHAGSALIRWLGAPREQ
jgi:hypothetical protein